MEWQDADDLGDSDDSDDETMMPSSSRKVAEHQRDLNITALPEIISNHL